MNIPWLGTMRDQKATIGELTLWVIRLAQGRWLWTVTREGRMITASGKVRKEYKKLASGECGCRKVAVNEVVYQGWLRGMLLGRRRRIGNHALHGLRSKPTTTIIYDGT